MLIRAKRKRGIARCRVVAVGAARIGRDALHENDHVRVLEYTSDPGDKEAMHYHPAFVVYVLTGGTPRITTPDGKSDDVEFQAGDLPWRDPVTHSTENIGGTQLHAIIVELET